MIIHSSHYAFQPNMRHVTTPKRNTTPPCTLLFPGVNGLLHAHKETPISYTHSDIHLLTAKLNVFSFFSAVYTLIYFLFYCSSFISLYKYRRKYLRVEMHFIQSLYIHSISFTHANNGNRHLHGYILFATAFS